MNVPAQNALLKTLEEPPATTFLILIAASSDRFRREALSAEELLLAADASLLAVRKALLGLDYLAGRKRPERRNAAARRKLARELEALAAEQVVLGRTLRRLWLRRSRPSNFEITRRRLDRSVRSLRRAARALKRNRPPAPPGDHPGFDAQNVMAALRRSRAPRS